MSEDGICFESDESIEPGVLMDIAIDRIPFKSADEKFRALVKWCDVNGRDNVVHPYEIELKFL